MDYKSYVGNPKHYDLIGKTIFDLLKNCGLKPEHKLLDIGCGSLRVGKYLIKYLNSYGYYGIDPNKWLVYDGLRDVPILNKVNYLFNYNSDFNLQCFEEKFDYILANSIFIHACKSQIEKCFSEVNKVLKEDGKFIFNYIEGNDNESKSWTYPSYITYTKEYIHSILDKYPFGYTYLKVKYPGKQKFILVIKGE